MRLTSRTLESLRESQEIVDLYRDYLTSESLSGVVTDFSEDFLYLSLFDPESGDANGIAVCYRGDVTRLRWGGNEREAHAALVRASGAKPTAPKLKLETIESVLRSVRAAFGYVNVLTERMNNDITFIGEIEELDAESLLLQTYGTFSTRDRSRLLLRLDDITRVDADARYERSVRFLATNAP